ncbi:uncharacterized protein SPAPADRAFT_58502, partial [Spathaspora passalidarum NRRL Y-27907]
MFHYDSVRFITTPFGSLSMIWLKLCFVFPVFVTSVVLFCQSSSHTHTLNIESYLLHYL